MNLNRRSFNKLFGFGALAPLLPFAPTPEHVKTSDKVSGILDVLIEPPVKARILYRNGRFGIADAKGYIVSGGKAAVLTFPVPITGMVIRTEFYRGKQLLYTVHDHWAAIAGATAEYRLTVS